jgi:hypothetical protein
MEKNPRSWQKTIIIPVHKKGNVKGCEKYRGINVLNSSYKIYTDIIKNKLYTYYRNKLGEEQNGFQIGRSLSDGYFTLNICLEKHRGFNIDTHITFVGFKKDFARKLKIIIRNSTQ